MATELATRLLDDPNGVVSSQPQVARSERDYHVFAQRPLTVGDRLVDHVGHVGVALDSRRQR